MSKILIAGGSGILGTYLTRYLKKNNEITTISNSSTEADVQLDLLDVNKVDSFVEKLIRYDSLIFLVGLAHSKGFGANYDKFNEVNYLTLVNLINSLKKHDVMPKKIVFASTISVYGENYYQEIFDEDKQTFPKSFYGITKLKAENYLINNFKEKSWVLRLAPVYSNNFKLNIYRRTKILSINYLVGNGAKKLSLCNMKNFEYIIEKIVNDKIKSSVYNLSDKKDYTYEEILNISSSGLRIRIPFIIVKIFYFLSKLINSQFLQENLIKLLSKSYFLLP